jgi:HPr kinase/phosphorylase
MDVYGLGVLIQGDSGIGKSETGLELIKRGHRLVADDRVDVYQKDELTVIGEPPRILEHLLEIRGVGIIDVMNLFGASAVRGSMQIQLAIYLEMFSKDKQFDRLGNAPEMVRIADVDVPQVRIPVKTGRNLSIIIEAAAMNFRAREMGYDATKTFETRLAALIEENSAE